MAVRGVYPGSFNPFTVAHLTIAETALVHHGLTAVDLVLSEVTLAKVDHPDLAPAHERAEWLNQLAATRPWMGVHITEHQLLVDIAQGYDVLILGADKLAQLHDPSFYGNDPAARDEALACLPRLAVAPRPPYRVDPDLELPVPQWVGEVSATAVRAGRREWQVHF